jgi:Protein of unknown function (DUF2933)
MTTQTHSSSQPAVDREARAQSLADAVAAVPTRIKVVAGLAVTFAALLIAGVPLSSFVPFAGLAGCLGMHLFMGHGHGHGHGHGDHHAQSDHRAPEPDRGDAPVETPALDR